MVQISWCKKGQASFKLEYQSEMWFKLAGLCVADTDNWFINFLVVFWVRRWRDALRQSFQIEWLLSIGAFSISSFNLNASGTDNGIRQRLQQVEQPLWHGIWPSFLCMLFSTTVVIFEHIVRARGTISANFTRPFPILIRTLFFHQGYSVPNQQYWTRR